MNPADIHLVLFLSRATPLKRWERMGILERELAPYKALAARLGSVSIVTSGGEEELDYLDQLGGIRILYNRRKLSPNLYSLLAPWLHASALRQATVFKSNQPDGAWTALIAARLHHKPFIARAGYLWAELNRQQGGRGLKAAAMDFLQARVFKSAQAVFVTTPSMAERVIQTYRLPAAKIYVIPNAVDTDKFQPMPRLPRVRNRMCFVGRLSAVKNLENLIQAVSQLSHGSLVVIGEGEQRPRLESLARQLQARVEFKGRLPNEQIPLEINHSEIFILPSLSEGHPKALVEAMSCGAAVIANGAPGMRELVEHGKTGWLCQADAASLQDAIQALMSNPTLREALGRNARRYALENFALERVVEMEAQAIEEVCRGKGDEGEKTRDEGRSLEDGR